MKTEHSFFLFRLSKSVFSAIVPCFAVLFVAQLFFFSCSKEKDIEFEKPPVVNTLEKPEEPKPVEPALDSVFYAENIDGFEMVAVSKSGKALFIQADTVYPFRVVLDSCQTNRVLAYCDSAGVVERVCLGENVYDILYHADESKMDIQYNKDGKLAYIKDMENPYLRYNEESRASNKGNDIKGRYYVYIGERTTKYLYDFINEAAATPNSSLYKYVGWFFEIPGKQQVATELIYKAYGKQYKSDMEAFFEKMVELTKRTDNWIRKELYGEAIVELNSRAEQVKKDTAIYLVSRVLFADTLKTNFMVGILLQDADSAKISSDHCIMKMSTMYSPRSIDFPLKFKEIIVTQTKQVITMIRPGKKYKFKAYLSPPSLYKKQRLDAYYVNGPIKEFYYLEAKAQHQNVEDRSASIHLSTDRMGRHVKMGVLVGTDTLTLKTKGLKFEFESDGNTPKNIYSEMVNLHNLEPNTTYYYMPYIIHDGHMVNRRLANITDVIYDKDKTFYGDFKQFTTKEEEEPEDEKEKPENSTKGWWVGTWEWVAKVEGEDVETGQYMTFYEDGTFESIGSGYYEITSSYLKLFDENGNFVAITYYLRVSDDHWIIDYYSEPQEEYWTHLYRR